MATWGNLANRVLAFCYKHWDGHVPEIDPAALRPADLELLAAIEAGFQSVGRELEAVHLRAALQEAIRLASEVNKYLDTSAPWFEIKTDKEAAAKSVYTALKAIDSLKVLFAPFLPFTSEKLNGFFGYETPLFGEQYTETVKDSLGEHTRAALSLVQLDQDAVEAERTTSPARSSIRPRRCSRSWKKVWLKRKGRGWENERDGAA